MKIYAVFLGWGEYEEYQEEPYKAFLSEEKAKELRSSLYLLFRARQDKLNEVDKLFKRPSHRQFPGNREWLDEYDRLNPNRKAIAQERDQFIHDLFNEHPVGRGRDCAVIYEIEVQE